MIKMDRRNEYYRAVVVFECETHNRFRAFESNMVDDVIKAFEEMEKALLKRASKDWTLTLEKHLEKNHIQIMRIRTASESVKSPLF